MSLSDTQIIKKLNIKNSDKVLDIGGSMKQHSEIFVNTLADIIRPEEAPYTKSKLKAKKFVRVDITKEKLPFKDKEFDVALCTHVLEDLPTPFPVISEMQRVAKRGYISTPSMGRDMIFSHYNLTDWETGGRRVPGWSHHKWLFYKSGKNMYILPKNYGVLYSSEFHFTNWSGNDEFQYFWTKSINYKEIKDLNVHLLISQYRKYVQKNIRYLTKGRPLLYFDNPLFILKEFVKKMVLRKLKTG